MLGINYLAVAVTTVAAFVASSLWYIVFGKERMKLLGNDPGATADMRKTPPWKMLSEIVRSFVVAYVLARFVVLLGVDWRGAVRLGLWLWIGFPFMILRVPLSGIEGHGSSPPFIAGDWLMKLPLMAVILGVWR